MVKVKMRNERHLVDCAVYGQSEILKMNSNSVKLLIAILLYSILYTDYKEYLIQTYQV